jgi:hypothetical protein
MAINNASPMDSGTKKKWKIVVTANCSRDSINTSIYYSPLLKILINPKKPPGGFRV